MDRNGPPPWPYTHDASAADLPTDRHLGPSPDPPITLPALTMNDAPSSSHSSSIFGAIDRPTGGRNPAGQHAEEPPLAPLPAVSTMDPIYTRSLVDTRIMPTVQKDADDPTTPPPSSRDMARRDSTTFTTLSRLFAVQANVSPDSSRQHSYNAQPARQPLTYSRAAQWSENAALPDHLYSRGLLSGRHSDVTVNAFGRQYHLHRLILDRAPFFSSALSEPWLEANSREMTVHPEDIDNSITQSAFELALKRLYGSCSPAEEDSDPIGLFATGCWLEMQDLIDSSIESMLRQMTPETLSPLIRLVTTNYYGKAGDKILASAKSMLCRDGWKMPLRFWQGIPGDIIREIVGGDGFYIDGEWDRWCLTKRILDRRLKTQATLAGLVESGGRHRPLRAPAKLAAIRFDSSTRNASVGIGKGLPESLHKWVALYTHPDIEPILVLLDEGIHYLHLDFEQLQSIRAARDSLGLPVMSEKVLSHALWQQMELRQRVINAREAEMELGLSIQDSEKFSPNTDHDAIMQLVSPSVPPSDKGKRRAYDIDEIDNPDRDGGSWDGTSKLRKFWIPSTDCNLVMGGTADPIIATPNTTTMQRHASRLSAPLIQPEDIQWVADFTAATSQSRPVTSVADGQGQGPDEPVTISYSHFPPFRFAAEFPNPRLLKEKKRVYSRTVFYAGSLWNIYIQKVASSRSKQLGVYLHRAKERETEDVIAGTAGLAQGSVDERIGQLEREMILKSERRDRRPKTPRKMAHVHDGLNGDLETSLGEHESSHISASDGLRNRSNIVRNHLKAGHSDIAGSPPSRGLGGELSADEMTPDSESDSYSSDQVFPSMNRIFHVPTLPPYVDARPTIKTYFKIYSPSRGGRMLSVYESAPDKFNFSQSWGWKSSTLMLDEGLLGDDGEDHGKEDETETMMGEKGPLRREMKDKGDGKLRFMVVIGNV